MPSASYFCHQCNKRYPTHRKLFDTLYEFQKTGPEACPVCGGMRELYLDLDFQLGCGDADFKVVSASLPDRLESWLGEEEEEVTFYPFLVVLERTGDHKQFCWMPYWHVTGKEARYGQHAICVDQTQLESLITQAREKSPEKEFELA
jgi:DNA-directed RNA polymerase subunit RPC12/RpoP